MVAAASGVFDPPSGWEVYAKVLIRRTVSGYARIAAMAGVPLLDPLLAQVRARSTGIGSHIHGELHWRTVGANGLWLAEPLDGADALVIFLFALLHDSMRENDSVDPGHGPRAAAFAVALHAEGLLGTTPAQLETLRYACFEHTNGLVSSDPTVGTCWDADRLDLPRVGIQPDPARFSTARAREGPPELRELPNWETLHAAATGG